MGTAWYKDHLYY